MEKVITIPKALARNGELVIIPRQDYEEFLSLKRAISLINPTLSEKKAIKEGRKEIKGKNYLTLKQLKNGLEN